MDGTTSPRWGSGFKPVINNSLPASFVTFFPAAHEAKAEISWADELVAQKSAILLRAWCRVPVAAGPSTLRKGMTIMKRVGQSANFRALRPQQMVAASQVVEDTEEAQQANRRRLDSFVSPAEDALLELVGDPLSKAEMASAIMRAKVDVANCYLHEEYSDVSDQRSLAKQSQHSKKTVPRKRRFNDHSSINFEYASGGNGAAIYSELDPIISRAMQTGVTEIDVNMASITEAGAHLRSTRRNPRISLAASGMPELSDISDAAEPSSILTLEPNESMTDAKSPTKRASTQSPSPTKSIKSFRKRLSDTIVRLLPASPPRAEPSPVKSPSPPTPSKDSRSPRDRTPSISIPKSPTASRSPLSLSANSTPGLVRWSSRPSKESPFSRWRPKRKSEPTLRSLTTPSPYRTESSLTLDMEETSVVYESPLQQSRPKAPTPSKWNGLHPSTPSQKSPSTAAKVADSRASLELVKSLPEWMQHNQSPATLEQYDPSNIDFRPASPSFTNSVSWVNSPADAIESERTRIVRRRKSEPLARNMLKSQTSRRMSLSPQKSTRPGGASGALFTINEPTSPNKDAVSQIPEHSQASELFNSLATQSSTTNAVTEQTEDMDMDFGSLSWDYKARIEETLRERRNAPPPVRHPDDVFNDPNDRYRRESPPPADPIKRLARMAENGCYDQAGVMVVKEDGRLFVRFKLPLKYAHMFPNNQGDMSSYYSHSASPVPQSPILRFLRDAPAEAPDELPYDHPGTREPQPRSEWSTTPEEEESHPADKNLVVSDIDGSPAGRSSLSAVNEESHLADETLVVSDFGGSPTKRSSLSPEIDESYPSDATLVVSDFGSSPVKRNSSSRQGIASTSSASTLPRFPFTPDGQTITHSYVESPIKEASRPPSNSDSSSLSDLENTPPLNPSSELSIANMATANGEDQSTNTRASPSPADSITVNAPPSTSPISFTPVNQASAQKKSTPSSTRSTKQSPSASQEAGKPYPNTSISHDDTPERDFLRDFIRRSKPRRPSTTETGSPIAPGQRLPLGARSPNMETQPKEKRKFESSEGEENEKEAENKPEPAAKRVRHHRATPPKPRPVATADTSDDEDPLAKDMTATAVETVDTTVEQKEAPAAAESRRSSRLKAKPSAIPKSSIPAPTKVGRGRPPSSTLGSVRNEQQDLVHQTRANTRRNKGNAEYPAQVLARQSEEGDANAAAVGQQDEAEASKARRGKSVVWKEPLAAYQEEEKPKRGRPVKAKAKPVGINRVSKPGAKPSAAAQKQRSTRIAAGLGMAGNGTPAPKRATRASTRTRK